MFFFSDVIGHDRLKENLIGLARSGNMPHAMLLHGPAGIGKFALAMAYARYIHCTNRGEHDACGECPSCRQISALSHADLHFVFPIVAKEKDRRKVCDTYLPDWVKFIKSRSYFGIEEWLTAMNADNKQAVIYASESEEILHKMSLKSFSSPYKVMIVWLPERMNIECANKILKLLEEPAPHSYFIFVSNEPKKLLTTVLSRLQHVAVPILQADEIAAALQSRYHLDEENARTVASLSGGSYLHACENLTINEENEQNFDLFVKGMRQAYARQLKELKKWSEEVAALKRERLRRFLAYAERMIRENFIHNLAHPELNYLNEKEKAFSSRFAPFINERNVMQLRELFERAGNDIGQNANAKIVMFDLSINLILLLRK